MRLSLLAVGAALMLCQTSAIAQTNAPNANVSSPPAANSGAPNARTTLRDRITAVLQRSGFSDIHAMPSSFVVHAKDQDGNPVVMSITPDSVAELAASGTGTRNGDTQNGHTQNGDIQNGDTQNTGTLSNGGAQFVTLNEKQKLSSNLIGLNVYNNSNQNIGQIKDVVFDP